MRGVESGKKRLGSCFFLSSAPFDVALLSTSTTTTTHFFSPPALSSENDRLPTLFLPGRPLPAPGPRSRPAGLPLRAREREGRPPGPPRTRALLRYPLPRFPQGGLPPRRRLRVRARRLRDVAAPVEVQDAAVQELAGVRQGRVLLRALCRGGEGGSSGSGLRRGGCSSGLERFAAVLLFVVGSLPAGLVSLGRRRGRGARGGVRRPAPAPPPRGGGRRGRGREALLFGLGGAPVAVAARYLGLYRARPSPPAATAVPPLAVAHCASAPAVSSNGSGGAGRRRRWFRRRRWSPYVAASARGSRG